MADSIQKGGYFDTPLWAKRELPDGSMEKIMFFPITRYANIIGKPSVTRNVMNLANPDFAFLATREVEISDDVIFDRANQTW